MKNSFFLKCLTLGAIGFLLFIFLLMIQGVIRDRQNYRQEAISSVSDSVAGSQTLLGPLVYQVCSETWSNTSYEGKKERITQEKRDFSLVATPQSLDVTSKVGIEQRSRSLYATNVLNTKALLKAKFAPAQALTPVAERRNSTIKCAAPVLMVALDDPRGIRSSTVSFNGQDYKFQAGTGHAIYKRGMQIELPQDAMKNAAQWEVEIALEYVATDRLSFVPLGESTQISMQSEWPHPSFMGRFSPLKPSITEQGFEAQWRLTSLATNAGEAVRSASAICAPGVSGYYTIPAGAHAAASPTAQSCVETVDIRFVEPINAYSLSDRATKYGLLFVALTFVAVGMFEVMKKLRVHPVQYLLVGAAVCTFFLLLVSLSEHIGFAMAYAAGAAATTLLLAYYASHMLGSWLRGLPFGGLIVLLYGMLYALLQLEQTALVIGSIAMFVVLAAVMVLTRKVDWYAQLSTGSSKASTPTMPPTPAQVAAAGMQ
jgi:inner membrane protein